jgi:hypothetical protein
MQINSTELLYSNEASEMKTEKMIQELSDLQLAAVGGGNGDVVFA